MATVTQSSGMPPEAADAPAGPPGTRVKPEGPTHFVLQGVRFATYRALRDDLDHAGSRVRLTFDRGTLEFMTLSFEHERGSRLLFALISALATGLDLDFEVGGSTTFSREDLDRGLEPDECFYIANEHRVQGLDAIDLTTDPPPDLAVEIDVSRSSIDKLAIYAALGVPEFWRVEGDTLHFLQLGADGIYREAEESLNFPLLKRGEAEDWLRRRGSMRLKEWLGSVNTWIREELAPRRHQPGR
jgi:Uma2 family endonuclease